MNDKLKPAIIGGVVAGLLTAIPVMHLCCCLWAILGGALASYMFIKSSPNRVQTGEGAMLGVMAGGIGGLIYIVIGIPLLIVLGSVMQGALIRMIESSNPEVARQMAGQMATQSVIQTVVYGFVWAILLIVFSTLGGLLGVAIFEKRKGGSTPPPPPNGFSGGVAA